MHRNNVCFLKLPVSNLWGMCLTIPCSSLTSLCVPTSLLLLIATKKIRCLCCAWEALLCWCSLPRQVQLIAQKQCNTGWEPTLHNLSGKTYKLVSVLTHMLQETTLRAWSPTVWECISAFCVRAINWVSSAYRGQSCWRLGMHVFHQEAKPAGGWNWHIYSSLHC